MSRLTDEELAAMPPKSVRYPDEVKLYQENDFITAYGLHTDKRIAETGYKAAIGGGDNWEEHGQLQLDFLKLQGLLPGHSLLDIGCGTGRLARKAGHYLTSGRYRGADISECALREATQVGYREGWWHAGNDMGFFRVTDWDVVELNSEFDFVWAFSVFIHLPYDEMRKVMRAARRALKPNGKFLFSYSPEKESFRSGLKQFRKPKSEYQRAIEEAGLVFEEVPNWVVQTLGYAPDWAGHQHMAAATVK